MAENPRTAVPLAPVERRDHLFQAHSRQPHTLRLNRDLQLAIFTAEQLDTGDSPNRLKSWHDDLDGGVAQLHRVDCGSLEHQLLDLLQAAGSAGEERE